MKIHYKVKNEKDFDNLIKLFPKGFENWDSRHRSFFLEKTNLIITYIEYYKNFGYSYPLSFDEKIFKCN